MEGCWVVETMELLDLVTTPERPSSVCGFAMTLLLPILFVIYLVVRMNQVYDAAPVESSHLLPSAAEALLFSRIVGIDV